MFKGNHLPHLKFFQTITIFKINRKRIHIDFDPSKDYYKILEVDKQATQQQIKIAYYKLAKEYHPDKNKGKTVEKFKEINNAYDTLSDPNKRAQYNSMRSTYSFGGFKNYTNTNNQYNQYGQYRTNNYQQDPFKGFEEFYNRMKNEYKKSNYSNSNTGTNDYSNQENNFKKEYYKTDKKKEFYKNYFEKNKKYYKKAHYTKDTDRKDDRTYYSNGNYNHETNQNNYTNFIIFFGGLFFIFLIVRSNSQSHRQMNPSVNYYPSTNPSNYQSPNQESQTASTLYSNTRPSYMSSNEEFSNSNRFR